MEIKYRWASSLGDGFEGTPESVWGIKKYNPKDIDKTVVFCGMYGMKDFMALNHHKGKKYIWWCGSDIRHFVNGYWLDETGKIRINPKPLAKWINEYCYSWVENKKEADVLKKVGIKAQICPSFLGDVNKFKPQKINPKKRYYSSVSGNDFKLYGWDKINKIARKNPNIEYYLYGNTIPWKAPKNVIVKGRVPQKQMNEETKSMTGAIRMVEMEGCSEIIVKSVLWGQKPISLIDYPFLKSKNPREELLKQINEYPWNNKKNNIK
jgi:hypothetical protein